MNATEDLDAPILSVVETHWLKVARIILDTAGRLGDAYDASRYDEIAARIVALVDAGRLESQGNLAHWRYSEVRLPSADAPG